MVTFNLILWRHQMETYSVLLAICVGNSSVTGEFPAQKPVKRSFDVFFNLRLNKRLSKQWRGWWFETQPCPLWRHCNDFALEAQLTVSNGWFRQVLHGEQATSPGYNDFTKCALMTTYGDIDLGQHCSANGSLPEQMMTYHQRDLLAFIWGQLIRDTSAINRWN